MLVVLSVSRLPVKLLIVVGLRDQELLRCLLESSSWDMFTFLKSLWCLRVIFVVWLGPWVCWDGATNLQVGFTGSFRVMRLTRWGRRWAWWRFKTAWRTSAGSWVRSKRGSVRVKSYSVHDEDVGVWVTLTPLSLQLKQVWVGEWGLLPVETGKHSPLEVALAGVPINFGEDHTVAWLWHLI